MAVRPASRPATRVVRSWHMDSRPWDSYAPRAGDIVIVNHPLRSNAFEVLDQAGLADETIGRPYPRPVASPVDFFKGWIGAPGAPCGMEFDAAGFFEVERGCWSARREANLLMVHYGDLMG